MAWYHGALLMTHNLLLHLLTDALARLASSTKKVPKHVSSLPSFTLWPTATHQPHHTGHDTLLSRDKGITHKHLPASASYDSGRHTQGVTHRASATNMCPLAHVKHNSIFAGDIRAASHTLATSCVYESRHGNGVTVRGKRATFMIDCSF